MENMSIYDYNIQPKGKKLYILGCDEWARQFAIRLINNNIYFHGFLSLDDALKQKVTLYNKPVINASACMVDDDIVISISYGELEKAEKVLSEYSLGKKLIEVETLKPNIKKLSNTVIYGTGSRAELVFEECKNFLNITFFADSSEKKWGERYKGKEIISPQKLCELPEDTIIIIGSTYYEDICNNLKKLNVEDSRIYYIEYRLQTLSSPIKRLGDFIHVMADTYRRKGKITFYGERQVVEDIITKVKLLDIHDLDILTRDCVEEDGTIFQLTYYDWDGRICILTDDINKKTMDLLEEAGIPGCCLYWMNNVKQYFCYDETKKYKFILDPTLGYSAISLEAKGKDEFSYAGFTKYEYIVNDYAKPCVLLILGGSTSQSFFAREVSWVECLSGMLTKKKISHTIYLGAVGGYSNIQEFLKLSRDARLIKPDIVLSYSGVNNTNESVWNDYPFTHVYQKELYEWIKENKIKVKRDFFSEDLSRVHINYGIKDLNYDTFEHWLLYERLMNSVCKELSMRFKAYLQPMLFSKLYFNEDERRLLLAYYNVIANSMEDIYACSLKDGTKNDLYTYSLIKNSVMFRKNIVDYREKYSDWLIDLSDIFDNEEDIYMDYCHVYEKGNKIIAKHIYETIKDDMEEVLNLKNGNRYI